MFNKILIFLLGVGFGLLVMIYHRWFVQIVGTNSWAEKIFGPTGTYVMWQLIGLLIIVITVLYIFGGLDKIAIMLGAVETPGL